MDLENIYGQITHCLREIEIMIRFLYKKKK